MHLKISSAKCRPFCPGGNELIEDLKCHTAKLSRLTDQKIKQLCSITKLLMNQLRCCPAVNMSLVHIKLLLSNLWYKAHQLPKLKCFSSPLAVVFVQSIEARCYVENEDVVGAAPTGDAPTISEWSPILLPTKVHLILEVWQYILCTQ